MMKLICYIAFILLTLITSCKESFEADTKVEEKNFLVVEGYINVGSSVTQIKLSRTAPLNEPAELRPESDAEVSIENDNHDFFSLHESEAGVYTTDSLDLPAENMYRIIIQTADQEQYASEFVTPIITPDIDSVSWTQAYEGVTVYVTTHDPRNTVLYYQWEYDETWEIHSYYKSLVKYEYPNLIYRTEEETDSLYRCWKYDSNHDLILASTETPSESIIRQKQLVFIPAYSDDRLTVRYRILVKQHALSQEEFNFVQIINKNSNSLGTFFDAQPSQVFGNILSTTSDKQVIGFVSAYTTASKQLFIINDNSLAWPYTQACEEEIQIAIDALNSYSSYYTTTRIWAEGSEENYIILGAYAATNNCVLCQERGGTNIRPLFWY